jgi:decaprenylphospho-beta-D-erythro-pentofuranosid-2-ulose 2-reductase
VSDRVGESASVIVGASSGVGRALLRALAERGSKLVIAARDAEDLEACALDARVRYGVPCSPVAADMGHPDFDADAFAERCFGELGGVDYLLVPAGGARVEDNGPNEAAIRGVLDGNFTGPARLAAAFGRRMALRKRGHIVLFSSIAASAPRTKNVAYSAAKAALETYARGLRHALSGAGVEVLVVVLGYVDTPQSFGEKLKFPVASPEAVASAVLRRMFRSQGGLIHFPRFWWWITTVLRYTPFWLYRRLKF